jgi:hypothetical protein
MANEVVKSTALSSNSAQIASTIGLVGGLFFAHYKKSGVLGYIGYGLLFSIGGGFVGTLLDGKSGKDSTKAMGSTSATPSSSSQTVNSALFFALPAIAVKLKYGMGQSTSDLRSKILAYANSYVGASKDYFIELMNMVKKTASLPQNDPSTLTAVMNALNDLQKNLKAKGYSDTEIQNAATQVGKDMAQFKFNQ